MENKANPLMMKLARGADLTAEDHAVLEHLSGEAMHVAPHQDLIREGEHPEYVHVVLKGFACRYKILPDGGRQIIALLLPGDFCDLHISLLGEMDHAIGPLSACEVARLPRPVVNELVVDHPRLTRAMWWATLVDESILREWIVGMGRRPADKRLAHLFCEVLVRLQTVAQATANNYEFPLTQTDIGDVLGLTLVHVNRVLQQFRAQGLIEFRDKRLTIFDVPALKAFADFDPNYLHLQRRLTAAGQGKQLKENQERA